MNFKYFQALQGPVRTLYKVVMLTIVRYGHCRYMAAEVERSERVFFLLSNTVRATPSPYILCNSLLGQSIAYRLCIVI